MRFFDARRQFEIRYFEALMAKHSEMSEVARAAGLNRPHCYKVLQRIGLLPAPRKKARVSIMNVRQIRRSFNESDRIAA